MVSALSRKEISQNITQPIKLNYGCVRETSPAILNKDNFPYALREFVNAHMNLPTFEEVIGRIDQPAEIRKIGR